MLKNHVARICFISVLLGLGLNLSLAQAYLKELIVFEDCLVGGGTALGIAILSEPAEADKTIALLSNNARITVPASVEIPQGEIEGYFEISLSFSDSTYSGSVYGSLDNWMQKAKVAQVPDSGALAISTFTATQGNGGVWLSWNGQEEDIFGNAVAGYFVQRKTNKGAFKDLTFVPSTSASYVDNLAEDGNSYTYRIQLRDSAGGVLATSPEQAISYSGGLPTITWINPPVDPVNGTITLRADNPDPTQESFTVYVDGVDYSNGFTDARGRGDETVIETSLDTTQLENGYHLVWLASEDELVTGRDTTASILILVENEIQKHTVDFLMSLQEGDFSEMVASLPKAKNSYTVTIENSQSQVVRTWNGVGSQVRLVWDGKDQNGQALADGEYKVKLEGSGGTSLVKPLELTGRGPEFLAVVTIPKRDASDFGGTNALYARTLRAMLSQFQARTGVRTKLITVGEEQSLSPKSIQVLRGWLKNSMRYFYLNGHGARVNERITNHNVWLGTTSLRNYNQLNKKPRVISIPRLLNGREYRFLFLDSCHPVGSNDRNDPPDGFNPSSKMTRYPHEQWRVAFNINLGRGAFIGWNGQSAINDIQGFKGYAWYRWRIYYWESFLLQEYGQVSLSLQNADRNLDRLGLRTEPKPNSQSPVLRLLVPPVGLPVPKRWRTGDFQWDN